MKLVSPSRKAILQSGVAASAAIKSKAELQVAATPSDDKGAKRKRPAGRPCCVAYLRFFDVERNEIHNFGGYTLAFHAILAKGTAHVSYAFASCHDMENFVKKEGRGRAVNRLRAGAADYMGEFSVQLGADARVFEMDNNGTVSFVSDNGTDLRRLVLEHFAKTHLSSDNVYGCDIELLVRDNRVYLDFDLLLFSADEVEPSPAESVLEHLTDTINGYPEGADTSLLREALALVMRQVEKEATEG